MTVTVEEAKDRLEELGILAANGEEVLIMQGAGTTLELKAVSVALEYPEPEVPTKRVGGQWEGRFVVGPEFFEPLPDEELDLWEVNSPRGRHLQEIGEAWALRDAESKGK